MTSGTLGTLGHTSCVPGFVNDGGELDGRARFFEIYISREELPTHPCHPWRYTSSREKGMDHA
jgi:hypothetical protein